VKVFKCLQQLPLSSFLASAYINNDEKIISEMENNHVKSFTHPPIK
jgi:hypothetical protein